MHPAIRSDRAASALRLQARNDLAGDNLDLIASVPVRHEDDLLNTDGEMLPELGNAFVNRTHDRAFPRAIALDREVPFLVQPIEHVGPYRFLRWADHDRQLRGIEQLVRVLAGILRSRTNLVPRLREV